MGRALSLCAVDGGNGEGGLEVGALDGAWAGMRWRRLCGMVSRWVLWRWAQRVVGLVGAVYSVAWSRRARVLVAIWGHADHVGVEGFPSGVCTLSIHAMFLV